MSIVPGLNVAIAGYDLWAISSDLIGTFFGALGAEFASSGAPLPPPPPPPIVSCFYG